MKENGDLHAVVLAGPGHRLYPLVDESSTAPLPKALLPIANRPMLCWTIDWLLRSRVNSITVVVDSRSSSKINHLLNKTYGNNEGKSDCSIDMLILDEHRGTVAVLLEIRTRLPACVSGILLVPCDLCTNMELLLSEMADQHRVSKASLTALFVPETCAQMTAAAAKTGSAEDVFDGGDGEERGDSVIIAMDASGQGQGNCFQLVHYSAKVDVEADLQLTVNTSTLLMYPNLSLRMDLLDVHCYIIDRSLLKSDIFAKPGIFSFREEALPRMVKRHAPSFLLKAFILPDKADTGYCLRANSIGSYLQANRVLAKHYTGVRFPTTTEVPPKSQVGPESLFGEYGRLGERSTIKKSVVGSHVIIGAGCKIANSVILDNCVIEDGCKLDGCVIGSRVVIKEKTSLKGCEVASQFCVEPGTNAKGEVLGASRELSNMFD